jgi:hypothetical protein
MKTPKRNNQHANKQAYVGGIRNDKFGAMYPFKMMRVGEQKGFRVQTGPSMGIDHLGIGG